jgi:TolB-like protein
MRKVRCDTIDGIFGEKDAKRRAVQAAGIPDVRGRPRMSRPSFFSELRRRNVVRAGLLYIGVVWALSQGLAQLLPVFDVPNWVVRAFVIFGFVGFPFWLVFAWLYELTPEGLKRESDVPVEASIARHTGRKLDFAIIAVLAVAVVLLITDRMMTPHNVVASDKSIAVLPFANTSGDSSNEYFSDGLSEELISALSRLANLKVIGRTSSFQFKGKSDNSRAIGAALGVAYLVEGSVRKSANRVRIAVSLLKAADGTTVWGDSYDRELSDIFAVQTDIADSVATKMKTTLLGGAENVASSARPSNGNVEAYNALLQGNFYFRRRTTEDSLKAIDFYKQAIHVDPDYALAYANLGFALVMHATTLGIDDDKIEDTLRDARDATERALQLDPNLAEAHVAKSTLMSNADLDLAGSYAEAERALKLSPQDQFALLTQTVRLGMQGRVQESVAERRKAIAVDPLSSTAHYYFSRSLVAAGDYDGAEAELRKSLELEPTSSRSYMQLAIIQLLRGDAASALTFAQREPNVFWKTFSLALAYSATGDRAKADEKLQDLIDHYSKGSASQVAMVYGFRKEPDKMFEWLDRAVAERDPGALLLRQDPFFIQYAADPRYAVLEAKMHLPDLGTKR